MRGVAIAGVVVAAGFAAWIAPPTHSTVAEPTPAVATAPARANATVVKAPATAAPPARDDGATTATATTAATTDPAPPPAATNVARVVIVSEDGLRPDVFTSELTPRHVALMQEGATARSAVTIPQSDTLPSHASMLSGVGVAEHGLDWNSHQPARGYIHVPTVFSVAHAQHLTTAMFVGKPKLHHIATPGTIDHFERPGYLCGSVARRAAEYFAATPPGLMFVHFSDPDEYGHSHGWMSAEYLRAVKDSDRCLATVLDAIDAAGLADTTLVIVTADHGGHGKHHSDGRVPVDRQIPWIVRGPGIAHGVWLDAPVQTYDTAATTLAALRLPALPHMKGSTRLTFTR